MRPVYHLFMDACEQIADKVELITPARFLFNGGQTLKAWNKKMLSSPHFKVLHYDAEIFGMFKDAKIRGGLAITFLNKNANYDPIGVFTPYPELTSILHKAGPKAEQDSLTSCIYVSNRFDLTHLFKDYPEYRGKARADGRICTNIFEKLPLPFTEHAMNSTSVRILGTIHLKRTWRYIQRKYIDAGHKNLDKWKVLITYANGGGHFGEALSPCVIAGPGIAYTASFIGLGAFDDEVTANNALKYVKSKFARAMLGVLKVTQDNNRPTWRYVPKQDFTMPSDIDWAKPVADIDQQLYRKYELSQEEIDFIESHVREMI